MEYRGLVAAPPGEWLRPATQQVFRRGIQSHMKELKARERSAMDAVAKEFSATWEEGSGLRRAYLKIAGKRVAVEIRTLKQVRGKIDKPRLRFDKVATRVIQRLREACGEIVPEGRTVLVTITAPIRLAAKTADALEERIEALLQRTTKAVNAKETVHGNHVEIRVVRGGLKRAPKLIGFVHNPETDSTLLLDRTSAWLELVGEGDSGGWLVVISEGDASWLEAHRAIYSQLDVPTEFRKVVLVFGDGSVESLTE